MMSQLATVLMIVALSFLSSEGRADHQRQARTQQQPDLNQLQSEVDGLAAKIAKQAKQTQTKRAEVKRLKQTITHKMKQFNARSNQARTSQRQGRADARFSLISKRASARMQTLKSTITKIKKQPDFFIINAQKKTNTSKDHLASFPTFFSHIARVRQNCREAIYYFSSAINDLKDIDQDVTDFFNWAQANNIAVDAPALRSSLPPIVATIKLGTTKVAQIEALMTGLENNIAQFHGDLERLLKAEGQVLIAQHHAKRASRKQRSEVTYLFERFFQAANDDLFNLRYFHLAQRLDDYKQLKTFINVAYLPTLTRSVDRRAIQQVTTLFDKRAAKLQKMIEKLPASQRLAQRLAFLKTLQGADQLTDAFEFYQALSRQTQVPAILVAQLDRIEGQLQ